MFRFDPRKLDADTKIGTGPLSVVYPYGKSDNKTSVVKFIYAKSADEAERSFQPIALGFNLTHRNIVPVKGYRFHEEAGQRKIYIKMPRMKESLKDKIKNYASHSEKGNVPIHEIVTHLYEAATALEYLESRNIPHQDLKPSNILFDHDGRVRISDIGMDRGDVTSYIAPELAQKSGLTKKRDLLIGDVWSLGVIIIELCTLQPERSKPSEDAEAIHKSLHNDLNEVKKRYGHDLAGLLSRMVEVNPKQRVSFKEVKSTIEKIYDLSDKEGQGSQEEQKDQTGTSSLASTAAHSQRKHSGGQGHSETSKKLQNIKNEIEEKWKDHFKFDPNEPWTIIAQDKSKITDVEMDIFLFDISERLKGQKIDDVQDLVLSLRDCTRITDTGLAHIASHIADNFKNLKHLKLDLGGWDQITNNGMTELINNIAPNLTNLDHLTLNFSYWVKVSDEELSKIASFLSMNLSNLTYLKLDLNYTSVTDAGVTKLISQLAPNLPKLETFILYTGGCFGITDKGITQMVNDISLHLRTLQHFALNFSFCTRVTDSGVTQLATLISEHLGNLRDFSLDFGGCTEITDKGFSLLATNIAHYLKKLQYLKLDFEGCTRVTDKPKDLLKKSLSHIPKVDIK